MTPPSPKVRGRPRNVPATMLLAFVTLGLWGAWTYFVVFREVDHQEGRRHSALWFLGSIPVLNLVFGALYLRREVEQLQADRVKLGLPAGAPWWAIYLWSTLGLLLLVGPLVGLALAMEQANEYWEVVYRRHGVPLPQGFEPKPPPTPT